MCKIYLLETGIDLRYFQNLPGKIKVQKQLKYREVSTKSLQKIKHLLIVYFKKM
jgi:site-specific recombinase XerD